MKRIVIGEGKFYAYVLKWDCGTYYVGSKTAKNSDYNKLMVVGGYLTSSKNVKRIIKDIGFPQRIVIHRFKDKNDAYSYETRLLHRVNARNNPKFLNLHNNCMPFFTDSLYGENNPFYGKKHSKHSIEKAKSTRLKNNGGVYHLPGLYKLTNSGRESIVKNMIENNPMHAIKNDEQRMNEIQDKRRKTLTSFDYWHQKHFVEKYENWKDIEEFTIELITKNECFPYQYIRKYGLTEAKARSIVDGFDRKYHFKYIDGKLRKLPGKV